MLKKRDIPNDLLFAWLVFNNALHAYQEREGVQMFVVVEGTYFSTLDQCAIGVYDNEEGWPELVDDIEDIIDLGG